MPRYLNRPIIAMVTDRRRYGAAGERRRLDLLVEDTVRAAHAGVDLIQIRESGLDDRALLALVCRTAEAVAPRARVLVNRRTDIALAASAGGVHLPATAPPASRVRELLPAGALVGRSVHSIDEAIDAERDGGCDYLTFGTVYPSVSKPAGHRPAGVDALRAVCRAVQLPVLAIGGIDVARAPEIAAAGAAGIAAIGMFVTGPRGDETTRENVARMRAAFDPGAVARLQ